MKVLVIIPAYNEEQCVLKTCKELLKMNFDGFSLDYVVINDASQDNTKKVCLDNKLNFIDLPCNLGIGGAVQTGYKYACIHNYDVAIQFDGDGQHDASYIKNLVKEIKNGSNLVIGSRYTCEENSFKSTAMRRLGSTILSLLIKSFTKIKITDPTSGFRACDNKTMRIFANDYPTDYPEPETVALIIKSGLKVTEIPVVMHERVGGKSSINALKSAYYMIKVGLAIIIVCLFKKRGD